MQQPMQGADGGSGMNNMWAQARMPEVLKGKPLFVAAGCGGCGMLTVVFTLIQLSRLCGRTFFWECLRFSSMMILFVPFSFGSCCCFGFCCCGAAALIAAMSKVSAVPPTDDSVVQQQPVQPPMQMQEPLQTQQPQPMQQP